VSRLELSCEAPGSAVLLEELGGVEELFGLDVSCCARQQGLKSRYATNRKKEDRPIGSILADSAVGAKNQAAHYPAAWFG
jgi:hypothetical protein